MPFQPTPPRPLRDTLNTLNTLDTAADTQPNPELARSAYAAADIPAHHSNPNNPLSGVARINSNAEVQARLHYYQNLSPDSRSLHDTSHQAQLVALLDTYLVMDRKQAVYHVKTVPVGGIVIVPFVHANNLRVACHYHTKHHDREYRTETLRVGMGDPADQARYLKVVRVA
jgi:hypothetical protein